MLKLLYLKGFSKLEKYFKNCEKNKKNIEKITKVMLLYMVQ